MAMDRIGDLLDPALRGMGVRARVREAQVSASLAAAVGDAMAPMCRVLKLERGTLMVGTSHPALAHQLSLDSPALISALNSRLGVEVVRRIRFVAMNPEPPRTAAR